MSDDEDYYDDDDYIYYEEVPYAEAVSLCVCGSSMNPLADQLQDDLAEHTMHSPVWIDYDPSLETNDALDELELYPSDFFDEDIPTRRKKRSHEDEDGSKLGISSKRRKLEATDAIPELSLGEPVTATGKVVWRSAEHNPIAHPVVDQGQGAKVAILKDWRDRSKEAPQVSFVKMPRKASQTMLAVVIERRASTEDDRERMPPPAGMKSQELPTKGKKVEPKALTNGTSGTASSRAKQRSRASANINGVTQTEEPREEAGRVRGHTSSNKPATAPGRKPPISNGRKRKVHELDAPNASPREDELANGDGEVSDESDPPPKAKAPPRGRKRKAPTPESEEDLQPPGKRTASARAGAGANRATAAGGAKLGSERTSQSVRKGLRKK